MKTKKNLPEEIEWLKGEVEIRTRSLNFCIHVPDHYRNCKVAFESGYREGWRKRKYQNPYSAERFRKAFLYGHEAGASDAYYAIEEWIKLQPKAVEVKR